jgi:hypothetical protein
MNPVQTLGQSLDHWQALYIIAIAVAFASTAAIVTFAFHIQEHRHGLKISNYIYVIASLLAVISTIVIVNKTKSLDAEKDRQSKAISDAAALQTQQAKTGADTANAAAKVADQKAQEARDEADATEKENAQLRIELAKLGVKTEGLETQQTGFAKQMIAAPTITEAQVKIIADRLKPFAGAKIMLCRTTDVPTARMQTKFVKALNAAGISYKEDDGMLDLANHLSGISVHFKNPDQRRPFADAIVAAFQSVGIPARIDPAQSVAWFNTFDDKTIYVGLGPE